MKSRIGIFAALICGSIILGGTGCHKTTAVAGQPKTLQESITDLRTALSSANAQVQSNLYNGVTYYARYGDYVKASGYLQQIANDPSLNDKQKAAVNEVSDLLKQKIDGQQNAAPAPH